MPHLIQRARSSQADHLISVLSDAVRDAALAPSDREALDIAGDALLRAAALVKSNSNQRLEGVKALYSTNCR